MRHVVIVGSGFAGLNAAKALRGAYPDITPGYHMNKKHWITVRPGGQVDEALVRDLVTDSYLLVVEKLARAIRPVDPAIFAGDRR